MSEPKFNRGDLVEVDDTRSPFYLWSGRIVKVEEDSWYQVRVQYLGFAGPALCLRFRSIQIRGVS